MMNWIFVLMTAAAVVCGLLTGRMTQVSQAAMSSCGEAVELVISLLGMLCLWSGLMRVAEAAGLTARLSRLMGPVLRRLFPGVREESPAAQAIALNMAANLLGLGNAATPLGITAVQEMKKESPLGGTATNDMAVFVVLNTASLQLIPTTTAALRLAEGAAAPLDILPAVWAASAMSLAAGVAAAKLMGGLSAPSPLARQRRGRLGVR